MKKYSQNMQQMYRKTTTPKCDFNNIAYSISVSVVLELFEGRETAYYLSFEIDFFVKSVDIV